MAIIYLPTRVREMPSRHELAMYAARGLSVRELAKLLKVEPRLLVAHIAEVYPDYAWLAHVARNRKSRILAYQSLLARLREGLPLNLDHRMGRWRYALLSSLPPTLMHQVWGKTLRELHPSVYHEAVRFRMLVEALNEGQWPSEKTIDKWFDAPSPVAKKVLGLPMTQGEEVVWRAWTNNKAGRGIPSVPIGSVGPLRRRSRKNKSQGDSGDSEA